MTLNTLLILLSFIVSTEIFANVNTEYIYAEGTDLYYNFSGNDGLDGIDGNDAESIYCADSRSRNGLDGEDGHNGEDGFDGKDAHVYYRNLEDLKKITLIQNGGKGGLPGAGGRGSFGCNHGASGLEGSAGTFGNIGNYGNIYLLENDFQIQSIRSSSVISLLDLYHEPILLGRHNWMSSLGAKKLFNSNSNISDKYFLYESTEMFEVKLKWSSSTLIQGLKNTKLAISLVGDQLRISNYRGAVLDYKVTLSGNVYTVEVFNATSELEFKNLSFGKIRDSHEKLTLEVKEKYRPRMAIETKFIITLYEVTESNYSGELIGQFPIKDKHISFINDTFVLEIGKLNFSSIFKHQGKKLRIHLSIYRKAKMQTRVLSLKGLFKI
jgi:hypothetical protein